MLTHVTAEGSKTVMCVHPSYLHTAHAYACRVPCSRTLVSYSDHNPFPDIILVSRLGPVQPSVPPTLGHPPHDSPPGGHVQPPYPYPYPPWSVPACPLDERRSPRTRDRLAREHGGAAGVLCLQFGHHTLGSRSGTPLSLHLSSSRTLAKHKQSLATVHQNRTIPKLTPTKPSRIPRG
jgi:hypothetical protein